MNDRLLRLDAQCPACGAPPRLRVREAERARYGYDPPDTEVATYQCHRRDCLTIYAITARAYQRAA
jgi:hypothetical protein